MRRSQGKRRGKQTKRRGREQFKAKAKVETPGQAEGVSTTSKGRGETVTAPTDPRQ